MLTLYHAFSQALNLIASSFLTEREQYRIECNVDQIRDLLSGYHNHPILDDEQFKKFRDDVLYFKAQNYPRDETTWLILGEAVLFAVNSTVQRLANDRSGNALDRAERNTVMQNMSILEMAAKSLMNVSNAKSPVIIDGMMKTPHNLFSEFLKAENLQDYASKIRSASGAANLLPAN
jgi:hypothetical protein